MAIIMIFAMSEGDLRNRDNWVRRRLDLEGLLARRSVLLFGPRQTGKTTYVRRQLRDAVALTFTLLDRGLLTAVLAGPTRIRREVEARGLRDTVVCAPGSTTVAPARRSPSGVPAPVTKSTSSWTGGWQSSLSQTWNCIYFNPPSCPTGLS